MVSKCIVNVLMMFYYFYMLTNESDMLLVAHEGMSENQDHATNGLRVLARIIAQFHTNRYRRTNAEIESPKQGEEHGKDA